MKYTLTLSKWVNGDSIGRGDVQMLNAQGFSCCLGQFAMQVGVHDAALTGKEDPTDSAAYCGRVYDDQFVHLEGDHYRASRLAIDCIRANDNREFRGRRIERLRKILNDVGHELEVVE